MMAWFDQQVFIFVFVIRPNIFSQMNSSEYMQQYT